MLHTHYSTLLFTIFFCAQINAQNTSKSHELVIDPLESIISSVYDQQWISKNGEAAQALIYCMNNRISYVEIPQSADDKYPLLSSFPVMNKYNPLIVEIDYANFNPATFIPLTYDLPFFSNKTEIIRVDGTNNVIVIAAIR